MRIAHITAGAGHMYCGSCLRDNVLAAALLDAGHDVSLIPTYTPTRPEGRDVSLDRVYMGGINVFLQEHFPFFRRTPRFVNRMLDAAPLLRLATRRGCQRRPPSTGPPDRVDAPRRRRRAAPAGPRARSGSWPMTCRPRS